MKKLLKQPNITIIVGSQWGDEGKGKIVDYIADGFDYVVRFHGGNNAGHTVKIKETTYKFHLLPSGVLHPHIVNIIGNGVVVDPKVLLTEIDAFKKTGINPRVHVSERAHVIMPYHIAMDEALTEFQGVLAAGSTKRGIAPVCADKAYRHGIRMGDLLDPELFKEKLKKSYEFNVRIVGEIFKHPFNRTFEEIYKEYLSYGELLRGYIADTELDLYNGYKEGKRILYEGAQGMSLDPDHGVYPHTTSTNSVAPYAGVGSGVGLNVQSRIIGVVKAYVSRVGVSPFVTELPPEEAQTLRDKGQEYGTTTGRPRRVGWLDLVQARQSIRTSGLTEIALTKLDVLGGFKEINVAVSYKIDGEEVTEVPASLTRLRKARAEYKTFSGWAALSEEEIDEIAKEGYAAIPKEMKGYIEFIEKALLCPIRIVSMGAKRHQTLVREMRV